MLKRVRSDRQSITERKADERTPCRYKEPLELREYDVPHPEPGAIVLRVSRAAICGSDLHLYRGDSTSPLPTGGRAMGHGGALSR
jgi:threonine dehydrogenase-like Zn-dependent dehydrogenase